MIAVLKGRAPAGCVGSGCLSLQDDVSRVLDRRPNRSIRRGSPRCRSSGSRARSSDHFTSSAVIGEPSENLMPSRSVSVTRQAVVGDLPRGREARLHALAVVGRLEQRVVEIGQDPDVDIGVVEHRIEEQAVGVAAVGQRAAALDRQGRVAGRRPGAPRTAAVVRSFFMRCPPLPVSRCSGLLRHSARGTIMREPPGPRNHQCLHRPGPLRLPGAVECASLLITGRNSGPGDMDFRIDRDLPVPLGVQLRGLIEYGIACGELARGEPPALGARPGPPLGSRR